MHGDGTHSLTRDVVAQTRDVVAQTIMHATTIWSGRLTFIESFEPGRALLGKGQADMHEVTGLI